MCEVLAEEHKQRATRPEYHATITPLLLLLPMRFPRSPYSMGYSYACRLLRSVLASDFTSRYQPREPPVEGYATSPISTPGAATP